MNKDNLQLQRWMMIQQQIQNMLNEHVMSHERTGELVEYVDRWFMDFLQDTDANITPDARSIEQILFTLGHHCILGMMLTGMPEKDFKDFLHNCANEAEMIQQMQAR